MKYVLRKFWTFHVVALVIKINGDFITVNDWSTY